jgi:hypothetical protein
MVPGKCWPASGLTVWTKLKTKPRKAPHAARKAIVEPVFGRIKEALRFRQFLLPPCYE